MARRMKLHMLTSLTTLRDFDVAILQPLRIQMMGNIVVKIKYMTTFIMVIAAIWCSYIGISCRECYLLKDHSAAPCSRYIVNYIFCCYTNPRWTRYVKPRTNNSKSSCFCIIIMSDFTGSLFIVLFVMYVHKCQLAACLSLTTICPAPCFYSRSTVHCVKASNFWVSHQRVNNNNRSSNSLPWISTVTVADANTYSRQLSAALAFDNWF